MARYIIIVFVYAMVALGDGSDGVARWEWECGKDRPEYNTYAV